jgi:hypothetical protein
MLRMLPIPRMFATGVRGAPQHSLAGNIIGILTIME